VGRTGGEEVLSGATLVRPTFDLNVKPRLVDDHIRACLALGVARRFGLGKIVWPVLRKESLRLVAVEPRAHTYPSP